MAEDWMGQLAAQDQYDNTERDFQHAIRQTPWFSEFQQRFGEEPDLNTPDYNYRAAWAAGAHPDVRDPGDNLLHWDSRYKGESHPNRFVNGVDTISGLAAPDERGFQPPPSAFEAAAARVRAPYRNLPAPGSNRIGQLAEQITSMPSWADVATQQMAKDKEAFQTGGIGSLLADTSVAQELAGGFGGTTKAVGKPVLGELASPFYSAAGRAVENAKLGKGTGEQWLGYLRNQPGVKPEELQYVFGNLPEGQLTKAQMQAHAAENEVRLGEVVKGIAPDAEAAGRALAESHGHVWPEGLSLADRERYIRTADGRRLTDYGGDPKYSQWQLPGGENYRETLLTLPTSKADTVKFSRLRDIEDKLQNPGDYDAHELNALRLEYKQLADETRNSSGGLGSFRSTHWDEPNVLAHIRTNDREIPGVGKSLHVEEIQSDWHQKGRAGGYNNAERAAEIDGIKQQLTKLTDEWDTLGAISPRRGTISEEMNVLNDKLRAMNSDSPGVPDAPFKSTWADVALKRQIREASEKGYDAISWTPGEAQAARYDLSKHIDDVTLHGSGSNMRLSATDKNGRKVIDMQHVTDETLADHIGKEAAEKLLSQKTPDPNNPYAARHLLNADLKVGGEGMKAFYDKMLVDKANALGKKHGARVEQSEISEGPTGKMKPVPGEARMAPEEGGRHPVHVLRITPELRAAAMKGFPLFTAGGVVAGGTIGELARQDKYGRNE